MKNNFIQAPAIKAAAWLNTQVPLELEQLRGKVVAIHAFQMLCPGCVSHGLPQTKLIADNFSREEVAVIGLHSVFEHHEVMTQKALEAFVGEYRINFPIAIDQPSDRGPTPVTMQRYNLKGTPSLVLIDKWGNVRLNHFGRLSDMQVGKTIAQLVAEKVEMKLEQESVAKVSHSRREVAAGRCDDSGCSL